MRTSAEPGSIEGLRKLCQAFHVKRLSLFGSTLRGDARPESDVDLLVEFEQDQTPGYIKLEELAHELSHLFDGRTIDLVTPPALHRLIRGPIQRTAKVLYEG